MWLKVFGVIFLSPHSDGQCVAQLRTGRTMSFQLKCKAFSEAYYASERWKSARARLPSPDTSLYQFRHFTLSDHSLNRYSISSRIGPRSCGAMLHVRRMMIIRWYDDDDDHERNSAIVWFWINAFWEKWNDFKPGRHYYYSTIYYYILLYVSGDTGVTSPQIRPE